MKQSVITAVIAALSLFIGGAGTYQFNQMSYQTLKKESNIERSNLQNEVAGLNKKIDELKEKSVEAKPLEPTTPTTKTVSIFDLKIEIPATWSVARDEDNVGNSGLTELPTLSVAQKEMRSDILNPSQVDIYFVKSDVAAKLVKKEKDKGTLANEQVGGVASDVVVLPLGDDKTIKEKAGGKSYFIGGLPGDYKTLVIKKQGQGDVEFELAFEQMIRNVKFPGTSTSTDLILPPKVDSAVIGQPKY